MSWLARTACDGMPQTIFFEDAYDTGTNGEAAAPKPGLERARDICASCPVRVQCFEDVMDREAERPAVRHGIRAGTTPQQRHSIWRRDVTRCVECGETYDPLGLVAGDVVCSCGSFQEASIPDGGDQWFPRHDGLLERLRPWVIEHTRPGDKVPPPTRMLEVLGHRRKDDMFLVYQRLVADGLVEAGEGRGVYYRRRGKGAWAGWHPIRRRRAQRRR